MSPFHASRDQILACVDRIKGGRENEERELLERAEGKRGGDLEREEHELERDYHHWKLLVRDLEKSMKYMNIVDEQKYNFSCTRP